MIRDFEQLKIEDKRHVRENLESSSVGTMLCGDPQISWPSVKEQVEAINSFYQCFIWTARLDD